MKLTAIIGNSQKLDGGAMFGNAPKALWSRWIKPDDQNRIPLACRALLIQEDGRTVLLETGIGLCFDPELRARYGIEGDNHILLNTLKELGVNENDIDFVILSHLHFDHAGGLLTPWRENEAQRLLFPNAKYIVGKNHWERGTHPHLRDRASFIPALNQLLTDSHRMLLVDGEHCPELGPAFTFKYSDGHTPGLLHTIYTPHDNEPILFASDLIPGTPWVHLPITMGYDRAPELLINEKKAVLDWAIENNAWLFYTHDTETAMSKIQKDEKGKYTAINALAAPGTLSL